MKIPLFDIDGTLFKTGGQLHKDAFAYAFKNVYGVNAKQTDAGIVEGRVDNQIIVQVLEHHGLKEKETKDKIKLATQKMAEYFMEHKKGSAPEILPGVISLLEKLKYEKIPMGVLTGNVEQIAWTKLERAGIKDFFAFGAFGDKVFKRVDLVKIARQNAEKSLKKSFKTSDFIIVGDTPRDIQCAKDAGIESIAVSTGIYPFEELVDEKPDLAVHSLEEKSVLEFIKS
ncbi:MAG: HAD family hydrolase [Patescibacteria group bacterium]|nr:HAD family hydrolase [Patescibacteria group bacterium]